MAKKRHHGMKMQTMRDRYHEHSGEERHLHGHYEGHSDRRRHEMMDAGMIHEDKSAIANLPQNVMIKPYPKGGSYLPEGLDDTIRGIDKQMDYDDRKRMEHFMPKKV